MLCICSQCCSYPLLLFPKTHTCPCAPRATPLCAHASTQGSPCRDHKLYCTLFLPFCCRRTRPRGVAPIGDHLRCMQPQPCNRIFVRISSTCSAKTARWKWFIFIYVVQNLPRLSTTQFRGAVDRRCRCASSLCVSPK